MKTEPDQSSMELRKPSAANGESHESPDYLKVKHGCVKPIRRVIGEERRHFVPQAWGVSKECPSFFKMPHTLINHMSYYNPFMNTKYCTKNEKRAKFQSFKQRDHFDRLKVGGNIALQQTYHVNDEFFQGWDPIAYNRE